MNAIIIDDEVLARELLKNLISSSLPEINIVAQCEDLSNGVKAIRKHKPHLVFLDIEMPKHSGIEILDFFGENEIDFGIIFTTAYHQYAIDAIKLSAVDYLLKPISENDLIEAVKRFESKFMRKISENNINEIQNNTIAIPIGQGIKFIELDNIVFFKADNSYTEIHLNDGTSIIASRTLKNFETVLSNHKYFFRCHKSYIINFKYVENYIKSDGGYLNLKTQHEIPITMDKVESFLEFSILIKR
jgi:two-component system LytT family response regulator